MVKIKRSRINVMVTDITQSINFYVDKLGLTLVNQYGNHYAEIQAPDLLIGLHPKKSTTVFGNNVTIGFGVMEFDKSIQQLQSEDIEVNIETEGFIRLAFFHDLDNNVLFLAENKA